MKAAADSAPRPAPAAADPAPFAVIELGSTSIRMAIAEVDPAGAVRTLDSLQQAVALGRDAFTADRIGRATTEACVATLRSFQAVLHEYGLRDPRRIRAVATSAVREALNRDEFLDRVMIATGLAVEVIDAAEVTRLTYLAVHPVLARQGLLATSNVMVVEVGGGSTEVLTLRRGRVEASHGYRLGSLRMRRIIEEGSSSPKALARFLASQADQTAAQIVAAGAPAAETQLIALGGDARFAAQLLSARPDRRGLTPVRTAALRALVEQLLVEPVDTVVRRLSTSHPEAETIGPALLVYARLARVLKLPRILVSDATLRDGLLADLAMGGAWTPEFRRQILHSALAVAARYHANLRHARRVALFARALFQALRREHGLDDRHETLLLVAALLHDIGLYVSGSGHHKHSMYLIANSDIFGLNSRELQIAALVARYHRRSPPRPSHLPYMQLARPDRLVVSKLGALLRVANALERGRAQRPEVAVTVDPGLVTVGLAGAGDVTLEQLRVASRADLFKQVYGMDVRVLGGGG